MTKKYARMTRRYALMTLLFLIAAAVVFPGRTAIGQTGTAAGGHDETVKRLQDKLAAFKNEALTKELTPILADTGEADLGAKLVESFLAGVGKINTAVAKCKKSPETLKELDETFSALEPVESALDEIDRKAILIQTYYDAISPDARNAFGRTAMTRMTNGTKPTVDALNSLGLERPANQIRLHCRMCFFSYEQIKKQLDSQVRLAQQFESMNAALNDSRSTSPSNGPRYQDYDDMPRKDPIDDGIPRKEEVKQEKPSDLTMVQQIEALAMGTAAPEQIMPLCRTFASTMDGMLTAKRNELAKLRQPAARNAGMGGIGPDGDMYYDGGDMPPMKRNPDGERPSFRTGAAVAEVMSVPNVAGLVPGDIRYFMARNLKQMVVSAKETDYDTLFKALCAITEVDRSWDVCSLVTLGGTLNSADLAPDKAQAITKRLELFSIMSGYRSDIRISNITVAFAPHYPDLSVQMCYNLGNVVLPLIKMALKDPDPVFTPKAKVTLIEAVQYVGDPDAAEFLIPLLVSKDPAIVNAAADAIGAVGDRRASAALVKGLANPKLADLITSILKKMGGSSQQEIIGMFKSGNPATDKFCLDILKDGGDLNALPALAAVLRRYHNALSMKDMPQVEKSEMLMLTMQAGLAIISRNMGKAPPALTVPSVIIDDEGVTRLDYGGGRTADGRMQGGMGMGMMKPGDDLMMDMPQIMPERDMSSGLSGMDGMGGAGGTATVAQLTQMIMQPDEIDENNAPFAWLEAVYIVAAKHIDDSATLMKDVQTAKSGQKIGNDIRKERIGQEFLRQVINTSEEGLSAYFTSRADVRKLKAQKDRVIRSLGAYQKQLNRMSGPSRNAFTRASTGVSADATEGGLGGLEGGSGTTRPAVNPFGRRL